MMRTVIYNAFKYAHDIEIKLAEIKWNDLLHYKICHSALRFHVKKPDTHVLDNESWQSINWIVASSKSYGIIFYQPWWRSGLNF